MEQQQAGAGTAASTPTFSANDSIDDLLGPDSGSDDASSGEVLAAEDAPEEQPEVTEEQDAPQEGDQQQTQSLDRQQQLAELAKQYQLDLNNPLHRKILRERLAQDKRVQDGQTFIQRLQAEKEAGLTEWERQLQQQTDPKQQSQDPKQQQAAERPPDNRPVPRMAFGDGFDHLQTYGDFYQREIDAWRKIGDANTAGQPPNFDEINAIENAKFARRVVDFGPALLAPYFQQMFQQHLDQFAEKQLGDVIPAVRQSVEQRRVLEARDFALGQLKATKDGFAEDWTAMTKVRSDNMIDGYPDTAFNQIIAENPWIQKIRETDPDPRTALVKTNLAQLRAARSLYRQQQKSGVTPEVAKQLTQTGEKLAEQKIRDRGRQQLNSGANNKRSAGAEDSTAEWLSGAREASTLGIPSSALFSKRR